MDYFENAFGASRGEVWDRIAVGLEEATTDGQAWQGQRVLARVGQWTVTLDADSASDRESFVASTRLRAPYINRDGFRFHISPESLIGRFGKLLGLQDVQVGDEAFDRAFLVRATDDDTARRFLSNPELRAAMLDLGRISLCVKDDEGWFGTDFPEGVDELYLEAPRLVTTRDELRRHFDVFALCLHQLCHIGSAYPDDPGFTLV